ncbi:uncharacterized [Tachysurus ichikawai]
MPLEQRIITSCHEVDRTQQLENNEADKERNAMELQPHRVPSERLTFDLHQEVPHFTPCHFPIRARGRKKAGM